MGNTDSTPIISQFKSLVQVISGDEEGARQTQENFAYRNVFPGLSQICSLGHVIAGDPESARKVQEDFGTNMSNVGDAIPVIGHIKGGIHYAVGDNAGGDEAMKSASRSAAVTGAAIGGMIVGGPALAVTAAVGTGIAMDGVISGTDHLINGENASLSGYFRAAKLMNEKENRGESVDAIDIIETLSIPVLDGLTGFAASSTTAGAIAVMDKTRSISASHGDPQKTKYQD